MIGILQGNAALCVGAILIVGVLIWLCPMRRATRLLLYPVALFAGFSYAGILGVVKRIQRGDLAEFSVGDLSWYSNVGIVVSVLLVASVAAALYHRKHWPCCHDDACKIRGAHRQPRHYAYRDLPR